MKKYNNIFAAIIANDIDSVKTFLPNWLEARDDEGDSPLHAACLIGRAEIVRLLLDYGADIEATGNYNNQTPLFLACINGHITIVNMLLDRGANIEARDDDGLTSIHVACIYGNHSLSELLVKRGANPLIQNNFGKLGKLGKSPLDRNDKMVKDKNGNEIPHRDILIQLRAEYLNKHAIDKSERTAALSSGWEMEM